MRGEHRLDIVWTWDGRPAGAGERAAVGLRAVGADLEIRVEAPFHGDPPPPGPPGPTPGLWEHEAVELFVAAADGDGTVEYVEVEMAPGGHHLVLRFRGVRRAVATGLPLDLAAAVAGGRWSATARLPLAWLPPPPWRAAAFALHGSGAGRRHLASVPLPGPRPDFHQPGRFPPLDGGAETAWALAP